MSAVIRPLDDNSARSGWKLTGEIDASTTPELAEAFSGDVPADVVIDVQDVTFIDSSGLRVLIDLTGRVGEGKVTLRGASRSVRRLLDLTGLGSTFELVDSQDD